MTDNYVTAGQLQPEVERVYDADGNHIATVSNAITVYTCGRCGGAVTDTEKHNRWHEHIMRVADDAFQGGGLIG